MFIFFLTLFSSSQTPPNLDSFLPKIEGFDFNNCATYSAQKSCFLDIVQPDFAVYLQKQSWDQDTFDQAKCFVITNGEEGRQHFFEKLFQRSFVASGWRLIHSNLTKSFVGLLSPDEKTFAAIGSYAELFSSKPKKEQYKPCLSGRLYYLRVQRSADDQEFSTSKESQGLMTAFGEYIAPADVPSYLERMGGMTEKL